MKRLLIAAIAISAAGCVVHDGKTDPEPIWWPNFLVRQATVDPANPPPPPVDSGDQTGAGGTAVSSGAANGAFSNTVKTIWFDPNQFYVAVPPDQRQPFATPIKNEPYKTSDSAPATLYPTRGQAAEQSNSATLYPARGSFQNDPGHGATIYPRGPEGPTGFRGQ